MPEMPDAPLMLSVSGARGLVGRTMTPPVAARFAAAYGTYVKRARTIEAPTFCVGRDGRQSGAMLGAAAMAGLTGIGARVIDLGVVATPTVGVMIDRCDADAGLVLTASHNPKPWNGLKCLNGRGVAPPPGEAAAIIEMFRNDDIDWVEVDALRPIEDDPAGDATHIERVLRLVDRDAIARRGFRVVLDSINGAGCRSGRDLLTALGCTVVHLNGEPNGRFAHTPEPIEENLRDLCARVRAEGATVGFAQDPDADRLAVVDEQGRFIGEEYTLVLAALQRLRTLGPGVLAANLSTSRMIDDVAAQFPGCEVRRTAVGEANVAAAMPEDARIGGEGNGGVIVPDVCWVRDSLSSMAIVLALLAEAETPLSAVVDALPRYAMLKRKVDLADAGGRDAIDPALERLAAAYAGERVSTVDGVRIDVADGWVHVRPSNTEPILRIIAEANTVERAEALADEATGAAGL